MALTAQELQLIETINFPLAAAQIIHQETGGVLEEAKTDEWDFRNDDEEPSAMQGVSVLLPNAVVETFVETQQAAMEALGCRAFWSTRRQSNGLQAGDALVVLPTTDMMEAIRWSHSDGANYGVSTEDIIARITHWRSLCDLQVIGAAHDWVALRFDTLPENLCVFAEDAAQLCPDTIDQGVGIAYQHDAQALAAARALCPGARLTFNTKSAPVDQSLADDFHARLQATIREASYSPEVKTMLLQEASKAASDPGLSQADGTKLLAYEINRTKMLFLWWD